MYRVFPVANSHSVRGQNWFFYSQGRRLPFQNDNLARRAQATELVLEPDTQRAFRTNNGVGAIGASHNLKSIEGRGLYPEALGAEVLQRCHSEGLLTNH
jgi:hypothetical protein